MKLWLIAFLIAGTAISAAQQRRQAPASSSGCSKEVRTALIVAVRSINEMAGSDPSLAWEFEKTEGQRSVNMLIGLADGPQELRSASYAGQAESQRELCKLQIDAGESPQKFSECLKAANDLTDRALDACGISHARAYPHVAGNDNSAK